MKKPSYGIDAPHVVRNLFLSSILTFLLLLAALQIKKFFWSSLALFYTGATTFATLGFLLWMLYNNYVTKFKISKKIVASLDLKGGETILDMGCGRGLLLIELARSLPFGKAYGIDLWQQKDQSGNSKEKTLQNTKLAGVEYRIEVETGDIQSLPYSDNNFDAVVSNLVIHNIPRKEDRERALQEMLRVLKPGGKFVISDIQYGKEYKDFLDKLGCKSLSETYYSYIPTLRILSGSLFSSDLL
ncbi:MAG: class I SAM-dependent methyltransferase [Verrucomicrobia bacterium]|nr:class I SAM-dependent methyltransferase [Verrucomicrobiota bacterium]